MVHGGDTSEESASERHESVLRPWSKRSSRSVISIWQDLRWVTRKRSKEVSQGKRQHGCHTMQFNPIRVMNFEVTKNNSFSRRKSRVKVRIATIYVVEESTYGAHELNLDLEIILTPTISDSPCSSVRDEWRGKIHLIFLGTGITIVFFIHLLSEKEYR